ncbi:glycosyltransferase [Stenotrophomonas sp. MMGLT7]|uniref:glycosyltransferase n=1 Tax=Stenotrophomonas sp. MMGLT7 TaxID=2901227 RepID=UPI001E5B3A83|nr:glycosyltransferase [Stenotrophomonas sp. MMGLT7]MCD7099307.1 glycosyltransferase [Stenotrophomonas sp. MMGLT7]
MTNMKHVLVVLGVYNGKVWLKEQIDSILNQQGVRVSLIVGDDCSGDGSADFIESQYLEVCEIVRFKEQSGGAGQNFLRLLKIIDTGKCDYVAFSDQDDIWSHNKLLSAVGKLESSSVAGYSCAVEAFWADGSAKMLRQNPNVTDIDFLFEGAGQGCSFVLRSDFVAQVQKVLRNPRLNYSGVHYHDWFIYAISRALDRGWIFDSDSYLKYRQHGGNDTGARGAWSGVKKRLQLIRSGWYVSQVRLIAAAIIEIGGPGVIPKDFAVILDRPDSIQRRLSFACLLFKRGRRRLSDRAVLAISAIFGWI